MEYPVAPSDLDNRPILLIQVLESDPRRAFFLSGFARWTGHGLRVRSGRFEVPAWGTARALSGFDPALLPALIVPEILDDVSDLAKGVDACVVSLTADPPVTGIERRDAFFGLALGSEGQIFLMQGDPHPDDDEEVDGEDDWRADDEQDAWRPEDEAR